MVGRMGTNAIVSWQTVHPFTPFVGNVGVGDFNKDGYRTDRMVPLAAPTDTYTDGNPAKDGVLKPELWGRDPSTGAVGSLAPRARTKACGAMLQLDETVCTVRAE